MAGDFNKPIVTDNYALVLQAVREVMADMAKGLDPALALGTANIPNDAIRWTSASKKWQKLSAGVWGDLSADYAINVTGSASRWTTGRTIQLTGAVTGTSAAWDGSGNLTFATTYSTVPAEKGGTGLTGYAIGDIIYASGATALSRLAGVAAGNVLLSGGVGAAPSWGKVGLTTHVSGVLSAANGGTGNTSNTSSACSGTSEYAYRWWSLSHPGLYFLGNNFDGSYWYITSSHGAPVRVGYADFLTGFTQTDARYHLKASSLIYGKDANNIRVPYVLSENADFNSILEQGSYNFAAVSSPNAPAVGLSWIYLDVYRHVNTSSTYVLQIVRDMNGSSVPRTWERVCINGTWHQWRAARDTGNSANLDISASRNVWMQNTTGLPLIVSAVMSSGSANAVTYNLDLYTSSISGGTGVPVLIDRDICINYNGAWSDHAHVSGIISPGAWFKFTGAFAITTNAAY